MKNEEKKKENVKKKSVGLQKSAYFPLGLQPAAETDALPPASSKKTRHKAAVEAVDCISALCDFIRGTQVHV